MALDPHGYTKTYSRPTACLLMRHPQTIANLESRYLGSVNSPLSKLGEEQRDRAEKGFVAWEPDIIYSSPLDRCLAIAKPASDALGCELVVDPRIIEMNFGILEDLTADEAIARNLAFPWGETMDRWPVEGAESMEAFAERTARAAHDIAQLEGRIGVVCHGGVVRGMLAAWLGLTKDNFWQFSVKNVESCELSFDEERNAFLEHFGLSPEQLQFVADKERGRK